MRCAIYVHVAATEAVQVAKSQIQQLKQTALREHWQLTKIYCDRTLKDFAVRPEYDLMMADAEQGCFDILLFWALDRLSHEGALATLRLLMEFNAWGVHYRSFTEPYLDSCGPHRQTVVPLLATFAKQQSSHISKQTKRGLARQRLTGSAGPNGRLGPGKPPVKFSHAQARRLREVEGFSYCKIAAACGVSKATIYRLFHKDRD